MGTVQRRSHRRSAPSAQQALETAQRQTRGVRIGRPRTYSPELCDAAIKLGLQGKNWPAIARCFGVDRSTLNKWAKEFPEFSQALDRARAASQAWWEDDIQKNRKAKHYQANSIKPLLYAHFKEDYQESRNMVNVAIGSDLLDAITEATKARGAQLAAGDTAKPVEPLSVAIGDGDNAPEKR